MFFGKLLPQEGNFFELFNQHADRIVEAARAFDNLVKNYDDAHLREKYIQDVDNAERSADRITHEVNRVLHKTFITPIDRDQIHSLINTMDDVADLIQDCAETMSLYDVKAMTLEIHRLTDLSVKCCERVQDAVKLLAKLAQPSTAEAALKTCEEIDKLESDADRVMRSAMSKLFREQEDVRELIKLKAIYELLETITDKCEDVANLIEGIVLENS
ncbi:MAG: DUF47 domain-containing protein [Betaproteobacteria bacterium]|jgi:uncharacterized protein|nr:DUF47 domain-containing protein [Betaproteobacteria bacterium]NBT68804.1 DUF47 domain-containing protein [Betaproteobacteria bacterium]NBY08028.1 DUF47 domain-containing protein [Betaproteobacteria bacterium]